MKCADCKWWKAQDVNGFCLRYPPQLILIETEVAKYINSEYPETGGLDYCGEFSEKETTEK